MEAAAAYLRAMRDHAGFSRGKLAAELGVSEMSIWRIEEDGQEPKAELFTRFVSTVRARWEDIEALMANPAATEEDGRRLADMAHAAAQMTDEELDEAIGLFESLKSDPGALARWLGYGQRLADERAPGAGPTGTR